METQTFGWLLARLHHKERWLAYLDGMLASHTVRQAAARLGVHRNTSFRWRHRFLALPRTGAAFHTSRSASWWRATAMAAHWTTSPAAGR